MKTRTIIEELTKDELVNLLCTATYGSNWLSVTAPEQTGAGILPEDCVEDIWAKALLAGHKIKCWDNYADGDRHGNLGGVIKEDGTAVYFVGLKEVKDGLAKCADGTFAAHDEYERAYLLSCWSTYKEDDGGLDTPQAEALMQVIMFGELIYG